MKKIIKMYLHSSKEQNFDVAEELKLNLSEEAMDKFKYALYEVEFRVELDTETGETKILSTK